jgi:carboxyl-terminal processing protease
MSMKVGCMNRQATAEVGLSPSIFRCLSLAILATLLGLQPHSFASAATDDQEKTDNEAGSAADDANAIHAKAAEAPPEFEELPVGALTEHLFKQIKTQNTTDCWQSVNRLVRLARTHGAVITDRLEKELQSSEFKIRLASARALCQLNITDRASTVMCTLVVSGETPEMRRLAANAIGLTTSLYGDEAITDALTEALKKETDELTKISISRSLWRIASKSEGKEALLKILNLSGDKTAKDEAALVLAENGFLKMPEVRLRLLNLYSEPTTSGERAFNLLRHAEEDSARKSDSKVVQGEQLMRELLRTIRAAYPDESKVDLDRLFEDAAKGMVAGLDPFSQYMDREEVKATQEMLQQDYGGIGAYVVLRNNNFVVVSPIYGSPADKAGLRALDIIQEVDGVKANELMDSGGMNTVIARLKGPPGTPVKVKFWRKGFIKSVEITIVRETIRVDSVTSTMLPGNIGYIRLARFGEHSAEEMQTALDRLFKDEHARGLVFDLRDNPGGLLRAGVDIADKFLDGGKLIVYSEGNRDFSPYRPYLSTGVGDESYPMVVLVNGGSASASEIVAGAMQDHKRALLIGERTFGKGSVQQIMPVKATDRQTQLRLTIAKYYLPSKRCIHEKGIDPDIEAKAPEISGWALEKILDLRRQNTFDDYIGANWAEHKDVLSGLALNDGKKCDVWPNFDKFMTGLKTKLEPNEVRVEIRSAARRRVQDEQKHELVSDFQEDDVLERGTLELLRQLKVDPLQIADYKELPEKFKKKDDVQQGAMLPDTQRNP